MKYTYAYKTGDGVRHEDTMNAPSREEVFMALRKKGIKAIKVVAADGSKANGEIRGVRKRVVVGLLGLVAVGVGVATFVVVKKSPPRGEDVAAIAPIKRAIMEQTRRQVVGDVAVIEKGVLTGWGDVFEHEGDRFLASFAIPGVKAGIRNTTEGELAAALKRKVDASETDSLEARQIKAMVEGIKNEARSYIEAGGTIPDYAKRLTERQDAEVAVYERAKDQFEAAKKTKSREELIVYWEELNNQLRRLGICPLSFE